ncbi:MAG: hypothetical protein IT406_01310 [Candidatus Yanofskybacteria bacterium]|nr:hypothetical protein [Candidatus Yanofskybacteria bacterium]
MESLIELVMPWDVAVLKEIGDNEALAADPKQAMANQRSWCIDIFRLLARIAERRNARRAYIADLTHTPDESEMRLVTLGKDVLTSTLAAQGIAVIDPESVRALLRLNPHLTEQFTEARNPFFDLFFGCGVAHQLYLPLDGLENQKNELLVREAKEKHITIIQWHVELELVLRPREAKTPQQ